MQNQGVVLRAALRLKDMQDGPGVQAVRAQTVNRLRRNGDKPALADQLCRQRDVLPFFCRKH